jgi:hypothetical protein
VVIASGCASTSDLKRVEATAEEALRTANGASQQASSAASTADQALQAAQNAQACCDANTERMDRMFRKSMYK